MYRAFLEFDGVIDNVQDLIQYDSFDAYFEAMMRLGGQGVGGWRKVG